MEKFSKVMLISIFAALVACSIQDALAEDITKLGGGIEDIPDTLKPTPIKNSEYQFHLQAVLRDADGGLISVTEATNGYYIPHDITDDAFDTRFGKKEIVIADNIKYEKVQYHQKSIAGFDQIFMTVGIPYPEVSYGSETVIIDESVFGAFIPLAYLEEGDTVNAQWTIFREFN